MHSDNISKTRKEILEKGRRRGIGHVVNKTANIKCKKNLPVYNTV